MELVVLDCGCEVVFDGPRLCTSRMTCCKEHSRRDDVSTRNVIADLARQERDRALADIN
jgi:hypothetical protein